MRARRFVTLPAGPRNAEFEDASDGQACAGDFNTSTRDRNCKTIEELNGH
jgi:hypothetical protein